MYSPTDRFEKMERQIKELRERVEEIKTWPCTDYLDLGSRVEELEVWRTAYIGIMAQQNGKTEKRLDELERPSTVPDPMRPGTDWWTGEEPAPPPERFVSCGPETKEGDVAVYKGATIEQVRWGGNDDPRGVLVEGAEYVVAKVDVRSQHTKLFLRGFEKLKFNSVSFWHKPKTTKPDLPPERPEPKFKVGDWVKDVHGDTWKILVIDDDGFVGGPDIEWNNPRDIQPATPPECVCEARRKEEEAKTIYYDRHLCRWERAIQDGWELADDCIFCHGKIKRSLLEE